jgi:hypothetical protein
VLSISQAGKITTSIPVKSVSTSDKSNEGNYILKVIGALLGYSVTSYAKFDLKFLYPNSISIIIS